MKYTVTSAQYESLTQGENPRLPTNLALASLRDNIEGSGLLEPLTVWEPRKGITEIVRGHRRYAAIGIIQSQNSSRFAELFGKGIPVIKVTDITAEEVVMLKLDHSEQKGLTSPYELQHSANMLFVIGRTESDVAFQLAGLIDRISPMNAKARKDLENLTTKVTEAKASGNSAAVTLAEMEVRKFVAAYRRGFVQNLHNTFRCPSKVMHALYFKATGGLKPEGVTEYLPPLGAAQVTSLWNAHKFDVEESKKDNGGVPKFTKEITGPKFNEKWAELCKAAQDIESGAVEKETKPKAQNIKEMEAVARESELANVLTSVHCGKGGADRIASLDKASYYGDLLRKHDAGAWAAFEKAALEIHKRLVMASNAAAVPAPANKK